MILGIDTTGAKQKISLYWKNGHTLSTQKTWYLNLQNPQDLILKIDNLLKTQNLSLFKLKGVSVALSTSNFVSTRVGITVANLIGWSLNIPTLGIFNKNQNLAKLTFLKYQNLRNKRFQKIVLPSYK